MAKRKRKESGLPRIKDAPTTSIPVPGSEVTTGLEGPPIAAFKPWEKDEATSDQSLEEHPSGTTSPQTTASLIHSFVLGKMKPLPGTMKVLGIIGWFVLVTWMYLQDNAAGHLQQFAGFWWFLVKITYYSVLVFLFIIAVEWLTSRITKTD